MDGAGFKNVPFKNPINPVKLVGMLINPQWEKQVFTETLLMVPDQEQLAISQGNLAFDANNMRLAMIWHGKFIDEPGIGSGATGFQPPAGSDVIRLPEGVVITELEQADSVWLVQIIEPRN